MAKISARGAHTIAQVTGTRPDEPDTHMTLTLTSDGRLLRQVKIRHGQPGGYYWSRSNNTIIGRIPPGKIPADAGKRARALEILVRRYGYAPAA